MRNDAGDVVNRKPSLVECFFGGVQHRDDGLFIHFLAGHMDRSQIHVHVFTCDWAARSAARHEQDVGVLSVASDVGADYAMRTTTMAQNSRARAVTKQHTRIAIGPVSD